MTQHADYFEYLRSRSRLGLLYRQRLLYPRLAQHVIGRVLDIGCGIGDFLDFRPGTVGVDVNPHAVEWCRQRGLDCHLMLLDHLPFPGASFDCAMLDNVLEHLSEPVPLLNEIRRVLVPGGRLIVGVPGRCGYDLDPDHNVFYDESNLRRVVCAAGFSCSHVFHTPFKSRWLASWLPQYCLYGIFERS